MKKMQSGFTLIELIAVIVILGILAATAVPRFVSLQDDANLAAMKGFAGALASGSDLNVAAKRTKDAGVSAGTVTIVDTSAGCVKTVADSLMRESSAKIVNSDTTSISGEYVISGGAFPGGSVTGAILTCTLTLDATTNTATFTLSHAVP